MVRGGWGAGLVVLILTLPPLVGSAAAAERTATSNGVSLQEAPQAQRPPRRGAAGGPMGRSDGRAGEPIPPEGLPLGQVEQMFDRYVINQARVALALSPAQMREVRPRLEQLQVVRRQAQRQRQRSLDELARLTAGADNDALAAKLQSIEAQAGGAEQAVREARQRLEDVLTVEQRARFRVFEVRMERQKLELIARARERARQNRGGAADQGAR